MTEINLIELNRRLRGRGSDGEVHPAEPCRHEAAGVIEQMGAEIERLRAYLDNVDQHVETIRHYLHLQFGKPKSPQLKSAPEIALDNLKMEIAATLTAGERTDG